jgi:hypothetical protein
MSMPFAAFSRQILILLLSLLGFAAQAGAQGLSFAKIGSSRSH